MSLSNVFIGFSQNNFFIFSLRLQLIYNYIMRLEIKKLPPKKIDIAA